MKQLYSILILIIFSLFFTSCSVKVKHLTFSNLLEIEKKLFSQINNKTPSLQLKEYLNKAKKLSKVSQDYANLILINNPIPVVTSGLSTEIYISKSFVKYIEEEYFKGKDIIYIFMHEIAHKKYNHSYETLSNFSTEIGYIKPDFDNLSIMAYIMATSKVSKGKSFGVLDSYKVSKMLNSEDLLNIQEPTVFKTFQDNGYPYTLEMELIADKAVLKAVLFEKKHIKSYINMLYKLKRIYELFYPELNKVIAKKMNRRINNIKELL